MALFKDGLIASTEDLRAYESSVLDVAKGEGIDLAVKLEIAQREVEADLYRLLVDLTACLEQPPTVGTEKVVVTDALFQWVTLHALELTFRDAYHHELNDRYKGKWREYERQSAFARGRYFDVGIGVVRVPVAKADQPMVSSDSGVMPGGAYQLRMTWQNAAGQEGSPSVPVQFFSEEGRIPLVMPPAAPANATGWNIYAGLFGGALSRQNASAIEVGMSWSPAPDGFIAGPEIGDGQSPDYFLRRIRMI